jgi:mono/diheme cytochrome c family protein
MKKLVIGTLLALFLPVISYAQMGGGMMGGGMGGGMMGPGRGWGYQGQPFQAQGPGEEIYAEDCRSCHAQGGNTIYPNLPLRGAPQMADFSTFLAYIRNPTMPDGSQGPMPAFSPERIPDDQAKDLYQYIVTGLGSSAQGGPGYGTGPGYGMGPGMVGRGYGMMGPGYGYGYGSQYGYGRPQQLSKPLDKNQAKQEVENYLKSGRNPNLRIGKIEEKGKDYEVTIETKEGSLANKILVNKDTGWMRSAY